MGGALGGAQELFLAVPRELNWAQLHPVTPVLGCGNPSFSKWRLIIDLQRFESFAECHCPRGVTLASKK